MGISGTFFGAFGTVALLGLGAAAVVSGPGTEARADAAPIGNFHEVSPGVYRGARPLEAGVQYLAAELKVKTDLDLEDDGAAIKQEKGFVAAESGMVFVSVPMSGFFAPHDSQVEQALAILNDPSRYPVFVHCQFGEDRTGLVVALFRVRDQGLAPADAYAEMLQFGFHRAIFPLNLYFLHATGYGG